MIDQHLLELNSLARAVVTASTEDHGTGLGKLLQLDIDVKSWERQLLDRPEVRQLTDARRELGFAIYAASSGSYVHAYAGLRLFLELSFASVYFSANELHRRRWVADREDFSWSRALDVNEGVLAPAFVREFSRTASVDAGAFANHAATCYRHCSQFIHGKIAVTDSLPDTFTYAPAVLADWLIHATTAVEAVLYLMYVRYGDELLPGDEGGELSATLESRFSHLVEVRRNLGLPIEQEPPHAR
jgi:hypothetical protein